MDIVNLINRTKFLFLEDFGVYGQAIDNKTRNGAFLVLGGAGSIGQAVVKELFKRSPKKLHVVDISENNLVELVRDIRSSFGYIPGEFQTLALDIGSAEYDAFIRSDGNYDYVLNLSALKHVRSERDPFTLMRMIEVNILNTEKTLRQAINGGAKKYFCVSTDKATNPVNMMGASKLIMEQFLMYYSEKLQVSTARFANVAFSDGSLLYGFEQRLQKKQPIVAPNDVKRYFITQEEAGQLCLLSCILGDNKDIFFPKADKDLQLTRFSDIAEKYLNSRGFEPYLCTSEEEAREMASTLPQQGKWPCIYTHSDTTGEKDFEEFFTDTDNVKLTRFAEVGVINNSYNADAEKLEHFKTVIQKMMVRGFWQKEEIVNLFIEMIPGFAYEDVGKYLDSKM